MAEAADLLARFLVDEGFATAPAEIEGHLRAALGDGIGWAALAASLADRHVGVATVQLSRSIELGLPAETADLWVEPGCRGRGIARALVDACSAWAAGQGSRSIQVTVTAEGAGRHGLDGFYDRLGFPDEAAASACGPWSDRPGATARHRWRPVRGRGSGRGSLRALCGAPRAPSGAVLDDYRCGLPGRSVARRLAGPLVGLVVLEPRTTPAAR